MIYLCNSLRLLQITFLSSTMINRNTELNVIPAALWMRLGTGLQCLRWTDEGSFSNQVSRNRASLFGKWEKVLSD